MLAQRYRSKSSWGSICDITGYEGEIVWDTTKPDGQPRRGLDVSRARKEFDFTARTKFQEGLKETIDWYVENGMNSSR